MADKYILFNPHAGNGQCREDAEIVQVMYPGAVSIDMTKITRYPVFFGGLAEDDEIILCGGDGTLNRFVNDTKDIAVQNRIFYFPGGSGNDFAKDIGIHSGDTSTLPVNGYLQNLPSVTVNGKTIRFLNNVGFGIDGYCCEVGDELRQKNKERAKPKPINYTAIAIKGLLLYFKPRNAVICVDGVTYTYKKVWLAPTMNGRYYGGGMMPTPNQDRLRQDGKVSMMVFHGSGKLHTLMMFPSIFEGEHLKYQKHVTVLEGHHIEVTFDHPTPLQIDGETVRDVTCYTVQVG